MKLISAHVQKFRNFDDSDEVTVQPDVTTLIGKNESGKTAFLQSLYRLNPVYGATFSALEHYPRWLYTKDRKAGVIEEAMPIRVTFELEAPDVAALEDCFGKGTCTFDAVTVGRRYTNRLFVYWEGELDEAAAVSTAVLRAAVGPTVAPQLRNVTTFAALGEALTAVEACAIKAEEPDTSVAEDASRLRREIIAMTGEHSLVQSVCDALVHRLPKFFYFGDYSFLGGRTDLRRVFAADEEGLTSGERTALALMRLAGADNEALLEEEYESRKAELEAVSNELTEEMADYWSQSRDLEVIVDVDKQTTQNPNGQTAVARFLEVRVKDRRHGHTNNFGERSNGFRWFFSFLAAFSEFEARADRIVILLDEPALTLHARAQKDFLRFIDDRLAPKHQVLFTTHSPFMVEPGHLERARLVEDKGARVGSKVTANVLAIDSDTLFPLQAALGYDLAQNLFIAPHNLLLEGTSDYTYLQVLSDHLASSGRAGLDERWTMLPVGSVTKISTFLALLGQHLDVTVLVDAGGENKAVADLVRRGRLEADRFITPAQVTNTAEADVEDLFDVDEYLELYNAALGGTALEKSELKGTDRIVARIKRARGDFNHGLPADHILRNREQFLGRLSAATLDRFQDLFTRINATLG